MKKYPLLFLVLLTYQFISAQFISLEGFVSEKAGSPENLSQLYYELQIASLNNRTTLDLFYDETVQEYIDLFLNKRKDDYLIYRKRSQKYFPFIQRYLEKYNIPPEVKYVAVVESGLSPTACSPSMAVGLWQFKEKTGAWFGLEINEYIDERLDPERSTIAACEYLNHLNKSFNNWNLSLLAYNAGPTALRNAIKANGGNQDYQSLHPYLSASAKRYLPATVALIYLFEYHDNHF